MSVIDKMLAKVGKTRADIPSNTSIGKAVRGRAVPNSREIERIAKIPRRVWQEDPDQAEIVALMTSWLRAPGSTAVLNPQQAQALFEFWMYRGLLGWLPVGSGKAQPVNEPVLTPTGWRHIGDLAPGDQVIGRKGVPTTVTGVHPQGVRDVYRLTFTDGSYAHSCEEHLWTFKSYGVWYTKPLFYWMGRKTRRKCGRHSAHCIFAPMCEPVVYPEVELPLDPYTLGALIGDGGMSCKGIHFTSMDRDIVNALILPGELRLIPDKTQNSGRATQYRITRGHRRGGPSVKNPLKEILIVLGLHGGRSETKFLPEQYLRSSIAQRTALLQGLMDTDGTTAGKASSFSTSSQQLARDVQQLVESLGGTARIGVKQTTHLRHYRLTVKVPDHIIPFRCERKRSSYKPQGAQRGPYRALERIEKLNTAECVCISVDAPDQLYLTRHHIPTHNTWLSLLAPVVIEAKRPLLFLPANLAREKFPKDYAEAKQLWQVPHIRVMNYEQLSTKNGEAKLRAYDPDCIMADEAHALKHLDSARTRKFRRFMQDYPDTPFLPMTGTPLGSGIKGVAHLIEWSLPPDLRPLPEKWTELSEWANALDYQVPSLKRLAPGALTRFCKDAKEASSIDGVRSAMGRRFVETPGIVSVSVYDCAASMQVIGHVLNDYNSATEEAFRKIHDDGETPDGHSFAEASQSWAHQHECALNFYQVWDPRAPTDWMTARREWHKQCREILGNNKRNLDSELMVANAIDRGYYPGEYLARWRQIKKSFTPNPVAHWLDDNVLKWCAKWLKDPGICWVYHIPVGEKLSELTGVPYYGAGGLDAKGNSIENHKKGPLIASIESNKKGRNLEHYDRNLFTFWPSTAETTEQSMGRTHRKNQKSDVVTYEVLIGARVQWDNVNKARMKARIELQKSQMSQKILIADWLVPDVDNQHGQRWRTGKK